MHHKQHLAAALVIQRPPSVTIALQPETVEGIDQFIRNFGAGKGIVTRSDAIQFLLEEVMPRYCGRAAQDEASSSPSSTAHESVRSTGQG